MRTIATRRTGKGQRIGKYIATEGGGGIFAGYTKCEQCLSELKVVMKPHDIRELSKIAGLEQKPDSLKVRVAKNLIKWGNNVIMREATRG